MITVGETALPTNRFVAALKNGGGIRAQIGAVDVVSGAKLPPLANPAAGKLSGGVSLLDIENSMRFNNGLMLCDATERCPHRSTSRWTSERLVSFQQPCCASRRRFPATSPPSTRRPPRPTTVRTRNTGGTGTIIDWAYEETTGSAINVGAIPEPSALALLGLGGTLCALRRRRAD